MNREEGIWMLLQPGGTAVSGRSVRLFISLWQNLVFIRLCFPHMGVWKMMET